MAARILVVDDDPDMRRLLRGVLERVGEVVEAADGAEALRVVREARPRLMLLDVVMPEMSGIAVLQAALEIAPDLPVLMLTGEVDVDMAQLALDSGAKAFITKPFDLDRLLGEVERILRPSGKPTARPWRIRR